MTNAYDYLESLHIVLNRILRRNHEKYPYIDFNKRLTTLEELDLGFLSNWMEWDHVDCFSFILEPIQFHLASKQMD